MPHRVIYSMSLSKTDRNSELSRVRGVMPYESDDQCVACLVESKIYLRLPYGARQDVKTFRSMMALVSKDGLIFHFRFKEIIDENITEEIKGIASLEAIEFGGVKPSRWKMVLPKGTLFPTTHMKSLIEYAIQAISI